MIGRKENGSLVAKAGRTIIDLALNKLSNRAVANSAVSYCLMDGIGNTNEKFRFGTDGNGTYGYIKKVNGADTFVPFSSGDLEVSVVEDALRSTSIALDKGAIYLAMFGNGNHGTGELKFDSGATLLHEVYIAGYTPGGTGVSVYCRIYIATSDEGVLNAKTTRITDTGAGRKLYKISAS